MINAPHFPLSVSNCALCALQMQKKTEMQWTDRTFICALSFTIYDNGVLNVERVYRKKQLFIILCDVGSPNFLYIVTSWAIIIGLSFDDDWYARDTLAQRESRAFLILNERQLCFSFALVQCWSLFVVAVINTSYLLEMYVRYVRHVCKFIHRTYCCMNTMITNTQTHVICLLIFNAINLTWSASCL